MNKKALTLGAAASVAVISVAAYFALPINTSSSQANSSNLKTQFYPRYQFSATVPKFSPCNKEDRKNAVPADQLLMSSCNRDNCDATTFSNDKSQKYFIAKIDESGSCVAQEVSSTLSDSFYVGVLEFGEDFLKEHGLYKAYRSEVEKGVGVLQPISDINGFSSAEKRTLNGTLSSSMQMMGNHVVSIKYEQPVQNDTIVIYGTKIDISY